MKLILLGPPGAGKGTQATTLAKKLNLGHISTGDILRLNVSGGTDLGKEAKGYMDKGALVPDVLVTRMLERRLSESDVREGFILDGFPRNINQAEALDKILRMNNAGSIDLVIYLETSEAVIINRLTGRLVCKICGANFHIRNMPPKLAMICDNCGGNLYQRTDDKVQTIKKRLDVYYKETTSLIDFYEKAGSLHRINADEDAAIVLNKIIDLSKQLK